MIIAAAIWACSAASATAQAASNPGDLTQRIRVQTDATGAYTWTFPTPYAAGSVPVIEIVAEGAVGSTDVVNVQTSGPPSNTQVTVRVTRTVQSVVSLLGLTILSVPTSVGVTYVDITARQP